LYIQYLNISFYVEINQVIDGDFSRKEVSVYLVLTSGELEHSAIKETLLFPSMASRSIRVATNNSSFTNREV
jgi:hypothetical protein